MMDEFVVTYTKEFNGIRAMDKSLFPTKWTLKAEVIVSDDCNDDAVNLTLGKIDFFFEQIIHQSVFYNIDNKWATKSFKHINNNIVVCPFEPADEKLLLVLQAKMNAIAEEGILFGGIQLESDTGSGIDFVFMGDADSYLPDVEEWLGYSHYDQSWWNRDDATTRDVRITENDTPNPNQNWMLKFDIIYPQRKKEAKQPAEIIRPIFKPTIIEGTKKDDKHE